jgi:A/G-specific adenine glycosylase
MAPRKRQPTSAPKPAAPRSKPSHPARGFDAPTAPISAVALAPLRSHTASYHYAQLLQDGGARAALLQWFEGVETTRSMPWRKKWVDPAEFTGREAQLRDVLMTRAYEVWVSEVSKF